MKNDEFNKMSSNELNSSNSFEFGPNATNDSIVNNSDGVINNYDNNTNEFGDDSLSNNLNSNTDSFSVISVFLSLPLFSPAYDHIKPRTKIKIIKRTAIRLSIIPRFGNNLNISFSIRDMIPRVSPKHENIAATNAAAAYLIIACPPFTYEK